MSIDIMSRVWKFGPDDKGELLVLLALADFANDQGECWPSISRVAEKARMSERGVQKIITRLTEEGLLVVRPNAGRKGTNLYVVCPPEGVNGVRGEPGSPRTGERQGVHGVRPGGERGSPEPSLNHQEPSGARGAPEEILGNDGLPLPEPLALKVRWILSGRPVPASLCRPDELDHMVALGVVDREHLRKAGLQ